MSPWKSNLTHLSTSSPEIQHYAKVSEILNKLHQ